MQLGFYTFTPTIRNPGRRFYTRKASHCLSISNFNCFLYRDLEKSRYEKLKAMGYKIISEIFRHFKENQSKTNLNVTILTGLYFYFNLYIGR